LLDENNIEYTYREYKKNPLTLEELQDMCRKLGEPANTLLRKRDKVYKELSLSGTEDDATLLPLFVKHPTLMQRPIFIHKTKAVVGRPIENMLNIV
jgi:arsenate reductase (glutaredoxin)